MKLVITLAGKSQRFINEGYKEKAFINIFDKKIIEYIVSMFCPPISPADIIFIARKDSKIAKKQLNLLFPDGLKIYIKPNKKGPVFSILSACLERYIANNEEVIISYCDFYFPIDIEKMLIHFRSNNVDGGLLTHNNFHPHRIYNSSFAYLKQNGEDVIEIKEKECFTSNPMNEPASSGVYYFKRFDQMDKYFKMHLDNGIKVNNEFFVTIPFNFMINDNLKVVAYETPTYICLGTPKDLELLSA